MPGTLEMLPFISRNKSLSHSRGWDSVGSSAPLFSSCRFGFYFVSKIHSLCQRLLTLIYLSLVWRVSVRSKVIRSNVTHFSECSLHTIRSKTAWLVRKGRVFLSVVNVWWCDVLFEMIIFITVCFLSDSLESRGQKSQHHKPTNVNESIHITLLFTFTHTPNTWLFWNVKC